MDSSTGQPAWNSDDKIGSLEIFAVWINELARETFLAEQNHPEMFFFVSEEGQIQGGRLKEELDSDQKSAIINREMSRLNPFGTIYTRIQQVRHDQLSKPDANSERHDGDHHRCLVVRMASADGAEKLWINPIIPAADKLELADVITANSSA
ncbi:MAG: hypothetical protein GY835_13545 [bacterium]|nr:hypothetical protein [bacterium]